MSYDIIEVSSFCISKYSAILIILQTPKYSITNAFSYALCKKNWHSISNHFKFRRKWNIFR